MHLVIKAKWGFLFLKLDTTSKKGFLSSIRTWHFQKFFKWIKNYKKCFVLEPGVTGGYDFIILDNIKYG